METIVGLYPQAKDGVATVDALIQAGFARQSVTVLRDGQAMWHYLGCRPAKLVAQDFGIGALLGIATYAFFGAIVAVGETTLGFSQGVASAALLVFMLIGVLVGGLMGLFFGLGSSEQQGRIFLDGIRRGGVIVAVRTADEHAPRALDVLQATGGQEVHVCMHPPRHTAVHAETMRDRLAWAMRLGARALGLALIMLVWSFLDSASMNNGVLPGILRKGVVEDILLTALLMTLLGVLVALRWEGIGGLIIVGSVLLFEGINILTTSHWDFSPINTSFLLVGLLFLGLWWHRSMRTAGETGEIPRSPVAPHA